MMGWEGVLPKVKLLRNELAMRAFAGYLSGSPPCASDTSTSGNHLVVPVHVWNPSDS